MTAGISQWKSTGNGRHRFKPTPGGLAMIQSICQWAHRCLCNIQSAQLAVVLQSNVSKVETIQRDIAFLISKIQIFTMSKLVPMIIFVEAYRMGIIR